MLPVISHAGTRRRLPALFAILGILLLSGQPLVYAAGGSSDWAVVNGDAAQSNDNQVERTISSGNVLKLKLRWTTAVPDPSYPVVSGSHIYLPTLAGSTVHARSLDIKTGRQTGTYTKGAGGGILAANGNLYLAGHSLEVLNPTTGSKIAEIKGSSPSSRAAFSYPLADGKLVIVGYSTETASLPNSVYAIDATTNRVLWHMPSTNAQAAAGLGRVMTITGAGGAFYSERTGKRLSIQPSLYSDWFAGKTFAYTVASAAGHNATIYAFSSSGRRIWSRTVGPPLDPLGWAHALSTAGVYVATMKPRDGVEALDPATGAVLWTHALSGVQRMAVANNLLFVLTDGLSQPLRLITYRADTGKLIGAISISGGYYAFPATNELMIASGMIFIRAINPSGTTQLLALGR